MIERCYPGAKWWKFDFHTHTPASMDFQKKDISSEVWLRAFMEKGIDCVAITDHNSGEWIDQLKHKLQDLENNPPDFYRPLYLFPGVEISVNGGIHVLAIFDPNKKTSDIDSLLGAVGYQGTKGDSNEVTKKSITEVIDIIEKHEGLAIPAHVDKDKGLFKLEGTTLEQALKNPHIYAMELCDAKYEKPQRYKDLKINWTEVCGSDTHFKKEDRLGHFTWVKMNEPSIEGLKLALMDGAMSVSRDMSSDPNRHSNYVIESITIQKAKYIGRQKDFKVEFSPFLNTIIGGRGSGKSTLIEFMRLLLRRRPELPEALKADNEKYFDFGEDNLLLSNSHLSLIYYKKDNGQRYRLHYLPQPEAHPSLEEFETTSKTWQSTDGEIRSLFPVYIYSQKQIFALAQKPDALLEIIDKDPRVEDKTFERDRDFLKSRYRQLRQRERDCQDRIQKKEEVKGLLNDVNRKIQQMKQSGYNDIMEKYHLRRRQLSAIEDLEASWREKIQQIENLDTNQNLFAPAEKQVFEGEKLMSQDIENIHQKWQDMHGRLSALLQEAKDSLNDWEKTKAKALWVVDLKKDLAEYQKIQIEFKKQGIDPEKYPFLLILQSEYEKELKYIEEYRQSQKKYHQESQDVIKKIEENQKKLTERRQAFLKDVLKDNPLVQIEVKPFGQAWSDIEQNLRTILRCDDKFDKDFKKLKQKYSEAQSNSLEAFKSVKNQLMKIYSKELEAEDKRFFNHLHSISIDDIYKLMCWFPEDGLKITFGKDQKSLQEGSPGQKTAALLAFILSYGEEPLLLDQPEDDLDNALIYDLIVKQLRQIKSQRQVIVVTHNANIVVNGDAEMVLPMKVHEGQSVIHQSSSLQDHFIRKTICDILEGGQKAFEQRYKRIHLED